MHQECVGEGNTSCHNKPVCQCLAHWESVLRVAWQRLVGNLGIQALLFLFSFLLHFPIFLSPLPSPSSSLPLFLFLTFYLFTFFH